MSNISGMCVALLGVAMMFAQQQGGQQPEPASPAEPEPEDAFYLDPRFDQIVIERKTASGEIRRYRYQEPSAVDPVITCTLELIGDDSVRYSYTLTNGLRARQPLTHFAVGAERPDLLTEVKAPDGWRAESAAEFDRAGLSFGERAILPSTYPRVVFNARLDHALIVGQRAGPFSFEGKFLPGLMRAYAKTPGYGGWVGPKPEPPLSRWLEEKLEESTTYEVATRQTPVIGPKFRIQRDKGRQPVLRAVAGEFRLAATMAEFQGLEADLGRLAEQVEVGGLPSTESLRQMGGTPLQKAFFEAMALNLEFAGTL